MHKVTAQELYDVIRKIPEDDRRHMVLKVKDINDERAVVTGITGCQNCVSLEVDSTFEVCDA